MAIAQARAPYRFTAEEYLAFERDGEERHEYLDGVIYAMAGESEAHGLICTNLTATLVSQLRGTPCRVLSKDIKVRSGPYRPETRKGMWSYPDLVVVCGASQYHDQRQDVLLNPTVLVEVLSPSTAAFDRSEKWERYRTWLPSLTAYVLVAQDTPRVEYYLRLDDASWRFAIVHGEGATFALPSIGCTVPLVDVYDRIVFPQPDTTDDEPEAPSAS
jgi:Uma2 family endonuclease